MGCGVGGEGFGDVLCQILAEGGGGNGFAFGGIAGAVTVAELDEDVVWFSVEGSAETGASAAAFTGTELESADGEFLEDLGVAGYVCFAREDRFAAFDEKGQVFGGALGGLGELLQRVTGIGSDLHVVIADAAAVDGKAVVMLGSDDDVFGPGGAEEVGPFGGVELDGVELADKFVVLGLRDLKFVTGPLMAADDGIGAPMDEDAEFGIAEPASSFGVRNGRGTVLGGSRECGEE